jgi:perosamine synthetase
VLLVHQVGMPADVHAIRASLPASIAIVEDAACAIGSTYKGQVIGRHSPQVVFSFHPRKLVTTGEGGMITLADAGLAEHLRVLRQHAMSLSDVQRHASQTFVLEHYEELGWNYRMTDIQAAVGLVQLGKLDAMVARRRELADRYRQLLGDRDDLLLPGDPPWGTTNYQSYCIKLLDARLDRNSVLQYMMDHGVGGKRGIMAAHLEGAYAGHPHGPLPESEIWTHRSLVLPMFHQMTPVEHDRVVEVFRQALAAC